MSRASPEETRARLERVVSDSISCARGLKKALADERRALEDRDTDALGRIVERKDARLKELFALEKTRAGVCVDAGFGADPDAMLRVVEWCDHDATIQTDWGRFRELAEELGSLNLTNGAIIRLRRKQVSDALALLRGDDGVTDTYGPDGASGIAGGGRALIEA